jgi:hypothetical protein
VNAPARLGLFGAALVVVLAGGAALGAAVGPTSTPTAPAHDQHQPASDQEQPMSTDSTPPADHSAHAGAASDGATHRIEATSDTVPAGRTQTISFRVLDPDGRPVTDFQERHERFLHLIVVSNDANTYAHLHPELGAAESGAAGTWRVELPALAPGGYRAIADTAPVGGPDLVLTFDLVVAGPAQQAPVPEPSDTATVDGFVVSLETTRSTDGLAAELTVRRDGAVVETEPYLGARGHLVAIDVDDLAYLHVHPEADADGAGVPFHIADPTPGRYRLFFDFSVDGQVRTAAFTVDIGADQPTRPPVESQDVEGSDVEGHGHEPGEDHP